MSRLAKFLTWCFAIEALVSGSIFVSALRSFLNPHHATAFAIAGPRTAPAAGIVLLLLALTALYAIAWWATLTVKAHARAWAIAASVVNVLLALLPLFLWLNSPVHKVFSALAEPLWLVLATGVAGLVVFSRPGVLSQTSGSTPKQTPRLPGDGTSKLVDSVAQLAGIAAMFGGFIWLDRWARARHLSPSMGLGFWADLLIASLFAVTVHELGHASVGRALGMRVRAFTVGPFQWYIQGGRWKFKFQASNLLAWTGGSAGLVPTKLTDSYWREVCMLAAGPVASLCLGLVALWATLAAGQKPWAPAWELLGFVAIISLVSFAFNLVPLRPEADYSDGARIYQLLTHSPWNDVHRAFLAVGSSLVTPLRPRDFDAPTLQRAAEFLSGGRKAFLLWMFSFTHFLDCGQIPEALQALAEAEKVFEQSASDVPGELLAYFVYASAFLKPDAARARHWWDVMEAKNPRRDSTDFCLARTSILWVENQPEEALKAWQEGNDRAQKFPKAGAYDFDRSLFLSLRRQLGPSSGLREPAVIA